jgi:DNA helicase II / ATP-dependent DNA helicase PcrA
MARRRFKLPGIQDLSKEQEDARALPLEGQHLIVGGPGTGKSVIALLRAKRLMNENKEYVFLVFNHLLHQSSKQLFEAELISEQWQRWFFRVFRDLTGEEVPRLPPAPRTEWQEINWDRALEIATSCDLVEGERAYLVIDEGQDMPPTFYACLANLGYENFFVVADQNQQIVPGENSSRKDIEAALVINPDAVIELTKNYRNNYPVARLAREFYTGDPASPPPELPPLPTIPVKVPLLYEYPGDWLPRIILRIAKMAARMPTKLIGVISPNNEVRAEFYQTFLEATDSLSDETVQISTYESRDRRQLAFDEGGVMVINAQSCKGLEFDIVFIAGLNQFFVKHEYVEQTKRLFYVMVARAMERVILLQERGRPCPAVEILPEDTTILERYSHGS